MCRLLPRSHAHLCSMTARNWQVFVFHAASSPDLASDASLVLRKLATLGI